VLENLLVRLDHHRRITLFVLSIALGAAVWFLPRLQIEDSPERWMPRSTQDAWNEFDSHFDVGDTIAIGVHFRRPVTEADADRLAGLRRQIATIPGIKQVYDPSLVAADIENVPLMTLIDPANGSRYPIYSGALWDSGSDTEGVPGRTLMLIAELDYLSPETQIDDLNVLRRACVERVDEIVDSQRRQGNSSDEPIWGDVEFHVASGIVIMTELEKRARQVAWTFLPAALIVGLLCLMWGFRSPRALIVSMLGSIVAMTLVLGTLAAIGEPLGTVTMSGPTLIAIIVMATTIHFAAFAADHRGSPRDYQPGGSRRLELLRWIAVPCLGAAATTGTGFLMLLFNELLPIRSLGYQLFAGSILAFVAVFIVTQWLPISHAVGGQRLSPERMSRFVGWHLQRPRLVVAGMLVLMAFGGWAAWPRQADAPVGLYVDADPFSFFRAEEPLARALGHFSNEKFGMYACEVVLVPYRKATPVDGAELGASLMLTKFLFVPPTVGEAALAIHHLRGYQQHPLQCVAELGIAAWRSETARENKDDADAFITAMESDEAQAAGVSRVISTRAFQRRQEQFTRDMLASAQNYPWQMAQRAGKLLTHLDSFTSTFASWNHDRRNEGAIRVTVLAQEQGPRGFEPLLQFVQDHLPEERFECYVTGATAQIVLLSRGLVTGLVGGLTTSLIVMAGLCWFLFRSWRLAAIAFLPNAFPLVAVFGLMGLLKLPISSGTAMVATVALGIALNDTIHFLLHYRKLTRDEGESIDAALDDTVRHIGRAIVLTSIVHVGGFSIFLLTDFLPLLHFGLLAGIAMLAAIVGDLVLLPCLLKLFDRLPKERTDRKAESESARSSEAVGASVAG
jgi:predicted RND superfamily exporter protein